jgi:uncharacterized protein YprB with RNaseH-like and TPR domain
MMSIKEKLAALQRISLAQATEPVTHPQRGHAEIGLTRQPTAFGQVWLRQKAFVPSQLPMFDLTRFVDLQPRQLAMIGKSWLFERCDPATLLFIDSETTGLAGGAGTFAFLVGVARWVNGQVVVRQYFLGDPAEEKSMYENLLAEFTGVTALVSYNGKSYDLPLIKSRCILNRIPFDWGGLAHLDLLHTVRRLCKGYPSYSLSEVETQLLRFRREADIPGALIPSLYFETVRGGDLARLKPVFQHNVMDLLSLIGITAATANRFASSEGLPPSELLPLFRTLTDLRLYDQAEHIGSIAESVPLDEEGIALVRERALLRKRQGDYAGAAELWHRWIEQFPHFDLEPYEELAKFHEHRSGDFVEALKTVDKAEKRLEVIRELHPLPLHEAWRERLRRRKGRLLQKKSTWEK